MVSIRCLLFGHKTNRDGVELDTASPEMNMAGYKAVVCVRCRDTIIKKLDKWDYIGKQPTDDKKVRRSISGRIKKA